MDDGARPAPVHTGEAAAWSVLSYLISGPLVYGVLGWLCDRWFGTGPVLVAVGIVGGMALALYLVWVRYAEPDRRPSPESADRGGPVT